MKLYKIIETTESIVAEGIVKTENAIASHQNFYANLSQATGSDGLGFASYGVDPVEPGSGGCPPDIRI